MLGSVESLVMIKPQMKIAVEPEVQKRLHEMASRYGMTGNAIVAAAAYELSRVRPENVFHALGRITTGEGLEIIEPEPSALPAPKKQPRRALPAG